MPPGYTCTQIVSCSTFSFTNKIRGNSRKLDKFHHVLTVRDGHSFAKRIVNVWNSLHDCIALSKSAATFRHTINKLHFPIIVIIEFYVDVHTNSLRVSCCKLHVVFNIMFTFFVFFDGLTLEQFLCL